MNQINRISGGLINREKTIRFKFNNTNFNGYQGDTLASALLANGQNLVARSFKYHRPRGIFSAGSEEPNALMQVGRGSHLEPNTKATTVELTEGLIATSQNHLGSLKYDFMAINNFLSPVLTAGFYYKTFMWPKAFWENLYEPFIRKAAGLGKLNLNEDPYLYDKGFRHCDLLIIGAGPAGLTAALTAGRNGVRTILADEDFCPGGRLNTETFEINGGSANNWITQTLHELRSLENVQLMTRTTIYGAYDHGVYGALEHLNIEQGETKPRQILWKITAKRSLLCTGATERSIAFGNNDRPAIMLAGAVRAYANRWGVASGKNITIFTNNDNGWRTAHDLVQKDVNVVAIIDTRENSRMKTPGNAEVIYNDRIIDTKGRHAISSITLSDGRKISTDCLAVSGGWNPNAHLTCHQRGRPEWDDNLSAFIPAGEMPLGMQVAGAANGEITLHQTITSAHDKTQKISRELGFKPSKSRAPTAEDEPQEISAFWQVKESKPKAWVDLQNDVTSKDIRLSHQEGFRSVEHLKRYTTLGMATDQGKTSNVVALAILADVSGKTIPQTGTTIFRPPYNPVSIGALGGRARGKDHRPFRFTPGHEWASEQGAKFVETGLWMRAQWFPLKTESHWRQSCDREVLKTRASVGICDVSTLGKIDIKGSDATQFVNSVYANAFAKLPIGKTRYGLMLREDGIVMDDGTTARLAEDHYLMTTTTGNAGDVFRHLEFCHQCLWPHLDVHLVSVTEQFAQYAIAGPNSRKLLEKIVDPNFDISNENFPFMACADITVLGGLKARLFRISFSGELAYELAISARAGDMLIRKLMEAGAEFDVVPYGLEALNVMRIEKGHPTAAELNGQTTAINLGMGKMVSTKKDFIGAILSRRPGLNEKDATILMGFRPRDHSHDLNAGAHFLSKDAEPTIANDEGWMTSVAYSPNLGHDIGLGFIRNGPERIGEIVCAADPLRGNNIDVEIVSPHFIDPEGIRLRA